MFKEPDPIFVHSNPNLIWQRANDTLKKQNHI
jgi:hypothetical protein